MSLCFYACRRYYSVTLLKEIPMPLKPGDLAPDFDLFTDDIVNKTKVKLSDLRGKKVVLLFYPMDFSPVCTAEHCAFGPELGKIAPDKDTVVFGVSCDSPYSHAAFRKQYNIAYSLLADPTRKMAKAYDMWAGEEPYNCSKRGTVVIGKDGRVTYYHEQPMREARKIDDLSAAVSADIAEEQRANESGSAVR
jgi:peroxiredoxin